MGVNKGLIILLNEEIGVNSVRAQTVGLKYAIQHDSEVG